MNDKIYAVMYSFYSDWAIYGYFTNREDADKYCVANSNKELYVKEIDCYDNIDEDFRNISLKYEYNFIFRINDNNNYELDLNDWDLNHYDCYEAEFLRSNQFESVNIKNWYRIRVNVSEPNIEKAKKIAIDLSYQYLDFCNKKPTCKSLNEFNLILKGDEIARRDKKKAEELKERELAELARLKAKYE